MKNPVSWGQYDNAFVAEMATWIDGRRVLEVFAGNGLLASKLSTRGVDIIATTLFSAHDGHAEGIHHRVFEMEASSAVEKFGMDRDVLLMAWPVASEAATKAALKWGFERPIIFVGEITRHDLGFGGLGGCASDLFFELTTETGVFESYDPRNMLERAVIRELDQAAVQKWAAEMKTGSIPLKP